MALRDVLSFPEEVDEVSARLVAAGVVVIALVALVGDQLWLAAVLAYGFVARVAAGPRFSPLALVATRIVRPRLAAAARPTPGPPKRFAQAIGAGLTVSATAFVLAGSDTPARWLLGALTVAATLESALGLCLGCKLFALGMRVGLVPRSVCEACADLSNRQRA